jgi:hypothetical protein
MTLEVPPFMTNSLSSPSLASIGLAWIHLVGKLHLSHLRCGVMCAWTLFTKRVQLLWLMEQLCILALL